jgi:hypothetical protein
MGFSLRLARSSSQALSRLDSATLEVHLMAAKIRPRGAIWQKSLLVKSTIHAYKNSNRMTSRLLALRKAKVLQLLGEVEVFRPGLTGATVCVRLWKVLSFSNE